MHTEFLTFMDWSLVDEAGATVAFVGYMVVFFAPIGLAILFINLPRLIYIDYKKLFGNATKVKRKKPKSVGNATADDETELTGEINAAISTALYLYFTEMHDEESNVVTIEQIQRRYSPWSSKIYGVQNKLNIR